MNRIVSDLVMNRTLSDLTRSTFPRGMLLSARTHVKLYTYPHTIENGAGERITFHRRVPGTTGDRLEGDNVVQPGAGPPCTFTTSRKKSSRCSKAHGIPAARRIAAVRGAGRDRAFRAGEPHRFWNAGNGELVWHWAYRARRQRRVPADAALRLDEQNGSSPASLRRRVPDASLPYRVHYARDPVGRATPGVSPHGDHWKRARQDTASTPTPPSPSAAESVPPAPDIRPCRRRLSIRSTAHGITICG